MPTGTVKWFDVKKGFGFIVNAEGKDVFVHFTSIEGDGFRSLKDGEKVEYEETGGAKGLSAKSVRRLKSPRLEARTNVPRMEPSDIEQPTTNNTASA